MEAKEEWRRVSKVQSNILLENQKKQRSQNLKEQGTKREVKNEGNMQEPLKGTEKTEKKNLRQIVAGDKK